MKKAYCRRCGHRVGQINGLCPMHSAPEKYPLSEQQAQRLADFRENLDAALVLCEELEYQSADPLLPLNRAATDGRIGRALGALRKLSKMTQPADFGAWEKL